MRATTMPRAVSSPSFFLLFVAVVVVLATSTSARIRTATTPANANVIRLPGWLHQSLPLNINECSHPSTTDCKKVPRDDKKDKREKQAHGDSADEETPVSVVDEDAPLPEESAEVGVKSHSSKMSNAVGDPDGDGSDDDSDSEPLWEEEDVNEIIDLAAPVQVNLELVNKDDQTEEDWEDELSTESDEPFDSPSQDGVVLRLGRLAKRKNRNKNKLSDEHTQKVFKAWQQYIYFPPSAAANNYLSLNARRVDGASKVRLDRRTLYAGLMLEWLPGLVDGSSFRKYLDVSTSEALRAALSMASRPQWRKTFPRPNAIRLYDSDSNGAKACTLAMQETIAAALAHSFGAGFLVLDDEILLSIRQKLLQEGVSEELVKPTALLQTLLSCIRKGPFPLTAFGGSIARCMKKDLDGGLDDPFDERAVSSCQDMEEWENTVREQEQFAHESNISSRNQAGLPLIIFLRVEACKSILSSRSATETLLKECKSAQSINLVVLGKGVDAKTVNLPQEILELQHQSSDMAQGNTNSGAPWFGFSPNNQNASGQNDPEGSRRFNIFIARTVHPNGAPGVLGAIAPPESGNQFPHMMAMQARERLKQQHPDDDDSPLRAELERWAQMLPQNAQGSNSMPVRPALFFNASLPMAKDEGDGQNFLGNAQPPPPEFIQQALQRAMSDLLDSFAQMNDDVDNQQDLYPDLHKAFAQVLRNENIRRGIAENLDRAAPALSDPKCQGVMLSIFVSPPPHFMSRGKFPGSSSTNRNPSNMGNWFQKILSNQEASENNDDPNSRQKRMRTLVDAAAVGASMNSGVNSENAQQIEGKAERSLAKLEATSSPIIIKTPSDPVRAKSWDAWIARERGAAIFRKNRKVLNEQLERRSLSLQEHVGTRGAGSSLRQMLSVKEIGDDMEEIIKSAVELEAAKSLRQHESPSEMHRKEADLDVDITLSQLLSSDNGSTEKTGDVITSIIKHKGKKTEKPGVQYLHPSSLEKAITMVCRISPSPAGGLSLANGPSASHRTREEIAALAQDKHERALISQVVSPQDIGVTYDMIGGLSDVKELLRQSITYPLKYPQLYSEGIAREAVKGVLLFGPPGTGKTMLAKAVATEGGASFLSVDASSVENKWLGESEKNAKAVFTLARRLAPCIVFIDEVDSLLSSRESASSDDSTHGTLTSVKTTMMSEWDGLNSGTNGAGEAGGDRVIVIGSTNRPFDLDEAVLRRFPRRILVDLPDLSTRTEILEVTLAENRLDPSVNLTKIAERLEGYTGSDIKEVCREAVVQISHEQAKLLDQDMPSSREDVTQGSLQRLRPARNEDFDNALSKLKRSVSETGRELARVWEWNDEYGEIKREARKLLSHMANMYL